MHWKLHTTADEPIFSWNRIANQLDETNMVMTAANYLDDETLLNHLPWLTPEEVQMILERRGEADMERLMEEPEEEPEYYTEEVLTQEALESEER